MWRGEGKTLSCDVVLMSNPEPSLWSISTQSWRLRLQAISVGIGFGCFAAAAAVTAALIPGNMRPRFAWPLACEWLVFTFCTLLAVWFTVSSC